ncbi:DsrE family protein [Alteromonas sp. CYL-A6]|uniref:DsrE family protein n=1 Tax=Alteromonas nitratireducens TaxID=3390813 RepID=UPI0034BFFD93
MASLLVILSSPPYGNSAAAEGIDFALAATNYGHEVAVLIEGDGVWQLQHNQHTEKGVKNIEKRLKSLALFDVEPCYVCSESLAANRVTHNPDSEFKLISTSDKLALFARTDHVVRF